MKDYFLHQLYNMTPAEFILICIGCIFIGIFLALIVRVKTRVKYTYYYSKKPHKMSLVIGHRGTEPVYADMYSKEFVAWLWGRLKGSQARLAAMKKVTGGKV